MSRVIGSVAVIGGGTMGAGIAGKCADAGCRVLVLDTDADAVERAWQRITTGRFPALSNPDNAKLISTGTFDELDRIAGFDWICEAVIEDLETKRDLFSRIEPLRSEGSVVSTNTSGIPLRSITRGMPERLCRDIVVTHFFNPVSVMRLLEVVPGESTTTDVVAAMADFGTNSLGKVVVHAKDTVNFIGNRIGCYWMLSGLHKARRARLEDGLSMETIDSLMSAPVGLPPTGLYGLIDLIGLDVMDFVGRNLAVNLPDGDPGHAFTSFPPEESQMLARGQLGRKSGGGFYRVIRSGEAKTRETFDLDSGTWHASDRPALHDEHQQFTSLMSAQDDAGNFARDLMGGVLHYAADLVPQISDDVVNIDRAMRFGFNWKKGPFELIDEIGIGAMVEISKTAGRDLSAMIVVAQDAGARTFYSDGGSRYLGRDGKWRDVPQI